MARQKVEKQGIDAILAELEKKYGVQREDPKALVVTSTGSLQLDQAMKIGGTPLGKIIEIFGPESSGKSTITLHQIAEYQKAFPDKKVALLDYEHSFDLTYASAIGVDTDNLLIYQPDTQEAGYDMVLALIEKDITSCIVIDSQTAAAPKAVLEGEMGDATIGLQARNNSKFCLKVKGLLSIHNCTLFMISQLRDAIGSMGEPTTTTGGKAIKFYADVRWKVWKMNDKVNELNKTTIDIVKNKVGAPFGQAKVNILWGKGFDKMGEIISYAVEFDIIKKGGAWYKFQEENFQGEEKVKEFLEDNPEVFDYIKSEVVKKLNGEELTIDINESQDQEIA
jgi:recombination protein RecA